MISTMSDTSSLPGAEADVDASHMANSKGETRSHDRDQQAVLHYASVYVLLA